MLKNNLLFGALLVSAMISHYEPVAQTPAQQRKSETPAYVLPDLLKMEDGTPITSVREWETLRRPEILALFEEHVYGKIIPRKKKIDFIVRSLDKHALNGKATRKEVTIFLSPDRSRRLKLLIYLPNAADKPVPVFLGLNFGGNQTIHPDTGITFNTSWTAQGNKTGFKDGFADSLSRGAFASRWPVELILARGYGLATAYYGDLQPDIKNIDSTEQNFHTWYYGKKRAELEPDMAGAIGIWAWGLSRALDYLITDKAVDGRKVAVIGHSRLGKTALWAAAQDTRFAMAISNNSGEGGAAITRRRKGETIAAINAKFPHWFSYNFRKYSGREDSLPVDFHELLALIAPRPLYVASSSNDLWADPEGEYQGLYYAGPVYELYGKTALKRLAFPPVDQPVQTDCLGYHVKSGGHSITVYDWEQYLNLADKTLR